MKIFYRVWNPKKKLMGSVISINFEDGMVFYLTNGKSEFEKIDYVVLMRNIGIKDNKKTKDFPDGQDIFEGDIYKDHEGKTHIAVITPNFIGTDPKNYELIRKMKPVVADLEVIGDIYTTPDKLWEGKN